MVLTKFFGDVRSAILGRRLRYDGNFKYRKDYFSVFSFFIRICRNSRNRPTRISYFKKMFGHLRRHPYANSSTLTVLDCNTPVTIEDGKKSDEQWYRVKVGVYEGYVKKKNISSGRVDCFQKKYPHFWATIKIEPGEQYYWGKLYDRYEQARSKVP